jgi:hypothetical protein
MEECFLIQTKRVLFSAGVGVITLIILIVIINPFGFNFKFTGFVVGNKTLNGTKSLLASLTETNSTNIVLTTTSTTQASTTTVATTKSTTTTTTTLSTTPTTIKPLDHVVFSEVFYDTPGIESNEEWIELYNPTSNSIDLSGLTIENKNDDYSVPNGTIISHDDSLVIARNQTGFQNLYGFLPDISGLTLSLHNDEDVLRLKNGSEEIDMVAWDNYVSGWDLKADEDESIQRDSLATDTDTPDDWVSHANPDPEPGGLITTTSTTTTTTSTTILSTTTSTTTTSTTTSTTTLPKLSSGDLVITEIMQDPNAVSDNNGEYFEIYNPTEKTFDLNEMIIKDNKTNSHTISSSILISPGSYVVLCRNNNVSENGNFTCNYKYSNFDLANSEDEVILSLGSTVIDEVWYNSSWPYSSGYSMNLNPNTYNATLNNNILNWCKSTSTFGSGDKGTPGKANDNC